VLFKIEQFLQIKLYIRAFRELSFRSLKIEG